MTVDESSSDQRTPQAQRTPTPIDAIAEKWVETLADLVPTLATYIGLDRGKLGKWEDFSPAGHDAMAFDRLIPFAMLFVRCRGGVSHNPAEFASPADIDIAARVLLTFLDGIAAQ